MSQRNGRSCEDHQFKMAINLLAGGMGGMTSTVVGHPLDTVKVRLQTMPSMNGRPAYTGMGDCIGKTIQVEGVKGLFKGVSAPMAGIMPTFALSYASYGVCQAVVKSVYRGPGSATSPDEDGSLSIPEHFMAGGLSALPTNVLASPINRVKCILQVQGPQSGHPNPKYTGAVDCVMKLLREGGYASLNKGWQATLLRDVPATSAFFGTYQLALKTWLPSNPDESTQMERALVVMFSGGLAGVAWSLAAHPIDTIKSRIQISNPGTFEGFKGIVEATRVITKEFGLKGLFRGMSASVARGFPANVAMFLCLETTKWFFGQSEVFQQRDRISRQQTVYSECRDKN